MDSLTLLLKRGLEVSIECVPSPCPRRPHEYVVEVFRCADQTLWSASSVTSLDDGIQRAFQEWRKDNPV